jgi:outer membrane protein TolC
VRWARSTPSIVQWLDANKGKFFPTVEANFNPTRQQLSGALSPTVSSGATIFNLYTAQVLVSYTFDVWGQNRRTVESLQAQADSQRFLAEAAYLTLTSNVVVAAIQEARCGARSRPPTNSSRSI